MKRDRPIELLVVGQIVSVKLVKWHNNSQTFELACSRKDSERTLEWTLRKTPKELFRFSKLIRKRMDGVIPLRGSCCCGGPPSTEAVEEFLESVFGQFKGGWLMSVDVERADWNDALARVESNKSDEALSPESKESMRIFRLDAALSEFLQLSVASLKKELHYDGKFPEGYLHKAPIYYHDELWFMNVIVIMQFVVAGVAVGLSVVWWTFWPLVGAAVVIIALMLVHAYLARPREPGRTIIIPCCFIPGLGQLTVLFWIVYDYLIRKNNKRWCIFRPGYIAYFDSNYDYEPRGVFLLDRKNTHIRSPWWHFCNPFVLQIANNDQTLSLHTKTTEEMHKWKRIIEDTCSLTAPRRLSLPKAYLRPRDMFGQRTNVPAQWYVDAKFFYHDVYDAIQNAQHEVFITGWMISPELLLVRDGDESKDTSLETVLGDAVKRGVKVHVLVYRDVEIALPNNSRYAKERLAAKGVQIIRHAAVSRAVGSTNHIFCLGAGDVWWSHHEKLVVVDQALAFVGGVDLAFGRYDDMDHRLSDPEAKTWHGKDFYNVRLKEFEHLEDPHSDLVDRKTEGRMPWHDIHCSISGNAAKDVARHFIARWNRELRQGYSKHARKATYRFLLPATYETSVLENFTPLPYEALACKVLRSIGPWSLSAALENSIKNKYLELIAEAERFIYIENQFFNAPDIADALYDRLWQALEDESEFRVIVVLPQWPAFEGMPFDNSSTKIVLRYQHKTMDSIINRLKKHPRIKSEEDLRSMISFYSLRKMEILAGRPISEQVYVHSKLMIVDDEKVIIGSANLNQRSLRGDRDSEVCLYFHAPELAHDLRCALYIEHLGLHHGNCSGCRQCSLSRREKSCTMYQEALQQVKDPLTPLWHQVADNNSGLLEEMFPGMQPRNEYTTIKKAKKGIVELMQGSPQDDNQHTPEEVMGLLRGHLVNTPLRFLRDETRLLPSILDIKTFILPKATFV